MQRYDPEQDLSFEEKTLTHVRVQKRTANQHITVIQGFPEEHMEKGLKSLKKFLCCNGAIIVDRNNEKIMQLQGDHREKIKEYLVSKNIVSSKNVVVHGF